MRAWRPIARTRQSSCTSSPKKTCSSPSILRSRGEARTNRSARSIARVRVRRKPWASIARAQLGCSSPTVTSSRSTSRTRIARRRATRTPAHRRASCSVPDSRPSAETSRMRPSFSFATAKDFNSSTPRRSQKRPRAAFEPQAANSPAAPTGSSLFSIRRPRAASPKSTRRRGR